MPKRTDPRNQATWPSGQLLLCHIFPRGLDLVEVMHLWRILVPYLGQNQATAFARLHFGDRFNAPYPVPASTPSEQTLLAEMTARLRSGGFLAWLEGEPIALPTDAVPVSPWHLEAVARIRNAYPAGLSDTQADSLLRIVAPEMSFRASAQLLAFATLGCYGYWLNEAYGDEEMDPQRDRAVFDHLKATGFIEWFEQSE